MNGIEMKVCCKTVRATRWVAWRGNERNDCRLSALTWLHTGLGTGGRTQDAVPKDSIDTNLASVNDHVRNRGDSPKEAGGC